MIPVVDPFMQGHEPPTVLDDDEMGDFDDAIGAEMAERDDPPPDAAWMVARMSATRKPVVRKQRTGTAIRFPAELHAQLEQAARERDVSINWLVNRAVADFLPRLIPADELTWTRP